MVTEHSNLEMRPIVEPVYAWRDHSRYVEIVPVTTGWLVLWGLYEDQGATKHIYGQRIYRNLEGVRRRLADQVILFTKQPSEARDALTLLDRQGLPEHTPAPITNIGP